MKTITIKIADKDYKLKYTIRSLFLFERITGKALNIETFADQITFFYCLILANNPDMDLTYDQFIDAIDNQDINIDELQSFVNEEQEKQNELRSKTDEKDKKGSKKK